MPFVEAHAPVPEWLYNYDSTCVISALESMFGQTFGQPCLAPEPVYQFRYAQITAHKEREASLRQKTIQESLYRQFFIDEMTSDKDLILAMLAKWIETDMELAELINKLDIAYHNLPFSELRELASEGLPVGVIYLREKTPTDYEGHMFHLGLRAFPPGIDNLSDGGEIYRQVRRFMKYAKMEELIEWSRNSIGYSVLLVKSGARMGL